MIAVQKTGQGVEVELASNWCYTPRGTCEKAGWYGDSRTTRRLWHVLLWGIPEDLTYTPRWVVCVYCGGIHVKTMPGVSSKRRFTRPLMLTLARWARILTWKQAAELFQYSPSTVEAMANGMTHSGLSGVTHIGIDGISRERGHVYVTNVYDLKRRRLLPSSNPCGSLFAWSDATRMT